MRKARLIMALILVSCMVFNSGNLFAKSRSRSSSSRSTKSSFGTKKSTVKPKTSSFGTKKTTTKKKSITDVGKKSTSTNPTLTTKSSSTKKPVKKANVYNKAKKNGTAFKTKKEATSSFRSKSGSKYTSKYTSKPSARPGHIPSTYSNNGTTYNINYNRGYGGYGYMGPLGTWIMYDMYLDSVMLNRRMVQDDYYYDGMQGVDRRSGSGGLIVFLVLLVIGLLAFIIVKAVD